MIGKMYDRKDIETLNTAFKLIFEVFKVGHPDTSQFIYELSLEINGEWEIIQHDRFTNQEAHIAGGYEISHLVSELISKANAKITQNQE